MTQSTQASSKKRLLYHFFIGNLTRRNKRGRSPPCSSSSSIPVQSLSLTDSNNNSNSSPIINHGEENRISRNEISDRIHYYPLTRYYVIVLMSLATLIISSSFILPTCTATALADPVPIRVSHSYSSFIDSAPKENFKESSESRYKIKSSNKNSNFANNSSSNSNNAKSPLTSFSPSQPQYTRLSVQENAFRPSYLYATKTIPTASTTTRAALLRGEDSMSTTTTDPVTITNKRLSLDPFFNFVNNFQSLASTESSSVIERNSYNDNSNFNAKPPAAPLQQQQAQQKSSMGSKKRSRKRTRQDDDGPFAFPLPNPIVITSTTSKPTLHPLLVLETEMRTTTSSTPSPILEEESSAISPSVDVEDINQPNDGPYQEGRANSGQQNGSPSGTLMSFESYEQMQRPSKNKNKSAKRKSTTAATTTTTITSTTENYISNHNSGGFSPSSGVVSNDADAKRLRSNFFDNFHDTDVDNIAEESGGPEITVVGHENSESGTHVNIPAGYSYAKKQNYNNDEFRPSEPIMSSSNENRNNEHRNSQNNGENNQQPQYQLKPSFHFNANNHHTGPSFQHLPERFSPRPVSKLRPNLQSYYDDSYHKYTAASENQYDNHGNSYANRPQPQPLTPPSPNYPPLPHLPMPIAIPMSAFPAAHQQHQQQHNMRPFMGRPPIHYGHGPHHGPHHLPPHLHHHRQHNNNHGSHYYGNNFPTGPNTKPSLEQPTGNSNTGPSGGNSLESINHNQQENDAQVAASSPSGGSLPTAPVTAFAPTYGLLEHSGSEPGIHTNKKVGIMDTFEIFYKEYKILTWAAFLIVTSMVFLCFVVFLYVNNPPTEVVTARNHLQEMLTSPQLMKFMTNLIDGGIGKRKKKSSREGKNRWKFSETKEPKKDL